MDSIQDDITELGVDLGIIEEPEPIPDTLPKVDEVYL